MKAQKSFNFAQRNEILIKEYHHQDKKEARNFTPKVKKIQLTTDSPTYKKIVHEFKLGGYNNQRDNPGSMSAREENNLRRTAQRSGKRQGKKAQARGSSQQHQKDWKPVRVNVKLD